MRRFFTYLSFLVPIFAQANVAELRAVLEQDLAVQLKITELKKEHKESILEIELVMKNAQALIDLYEEKTAQTKAENAEKNFKKELLLSKVNTLVGNLLKKEQNIEKLYNEFAKNIEKVPEKLREIYKKKMLSIEKTYYANSAEKNFAKLKFLSEVLVDVNSYQVLDKNTLVFGLNTEFYKENSDADVVSLFKIIEGESGYDILNLKVENYSK